MNAKDLQTKVGLQMESLGSVVTPLPPSQTEKEKIITDFNIALFDYTSEKLL